MPFPYQPLSSLLTGAASRRPNPAEGRVTHSLLLAVALGPKAAVRNCSSSSGTTSVTLINRNLRPLQIVWKRRYK